MVVVGFGRVGAAIGQRLVADGVACVVIDDRERPVAEARALGLPVVLANAAQPHALTDAGIARAAALLVAIPNGFEAAEVVADARRLNPSLRIVARAHGVAEAEHLRDAGVDVTVMAEAQTARGMLDELRPSTGPATGGRPPAVTG